MNSEHVNQNTCMNNEFEENTSDEFVFPKMKD